MLGSSTKVSNNVRARQRAIEPNTQRVVDANRAYAYHHGFASQFPRGRRETPTDFAAVGLLLGNL